MRVLKVSEISLNPSRIVAITPLRGVVLNPVNGRLSNAGSVYARRVATISPSGPRERRKRDLNGVLQSLAPPLTATEKDVAAT